MKINIDKKFQKYFNNTGKYIKEYRLFIEKGDTGKNATIEEEDLLIVADVDDLFYVLKDYKWTSRLMEVYKNDKYGIASRERINKAYIQELDGKYSSKIGLEVVMYGSFSANTCRKRIVKCLEDYIKKNRWKMDINIASIKEVVGI